jgi:murein DD-endopeptidase MepM/ murein hydrolase activator NlpD
MDMLCKIIHIFEKFIQKNYIFALSGYIRKVREEEANLENAKQHRKILSLLTIAATMIVCILFYSELRPNAYEVSLGDNTIAYVKNDKEVEHVSKALKQIVVRFNMKAPYNEIIISKVKVADDLLIKDINNVSRNILSGSDIEVNAIAMNIDGKEAALLASENEGKQVLSLMSSYYAAKSNVKPNESSTSNKISYSEKKVLMSQVENPEETAEKLEKVNEKRKTPLISLKIKGETDVKEAISPSTTITWSDELFLGDSKVKSNGKAGEKAVHKEVTLENGKVIDSKVINEKVLVKPTDTVVSKGTKNPITGNIAFLSVPSRGTYTSSFGMRWGKMHNGIDIGAPIGTPIYAALDGVVSFSGIEDGFGKVIKIDHGNGIETIYGHCSVLGVSNGKAVSRGDKIGEVGNTGRSTGPHVHFELRVNGVAKNPTQYLKN